MSTAATSLLTRTPPSPTAAVATAVRNAGRLVREGGAEAVKLEGGRKRIPVIEAILDAEVVMMGGGNTFRLLDSLHHLDVIEGLGERVIGPDPDMMHMRRAELAIMAGEPASARDLIRATLDLLAEPYSDSS